MTVLVEKAGPIVRITLQRPEARNALSPEMMCRLADAFQEFAADPGLRVAIVTGAGKTFCAGGDLGTTIPLLCGNQKPSNDWERRLVEDPLVLERACLRDVPIDKPIIAAVNGPCLAAGFEMVLGTDLRVASSNAVFAFPEVKRGVVPFAGSMARLPRQIGYARAMELLLVGDPVAASEALAIGLINYVVEPQDLMKKADELAEKIAANGPFAVQQLKRTVVAASGRPLAEAYQLENQCKADVLASEDAREGPRAFMEKRPPKFTGR